MNIVLIYPFFSIERIHAENIEAPPIGLHYLCAILKDKGHEVKLLNWHDVRDRPHIIEKTVSTLNPDLIGFSILHANRWGGIQLAKIFKEHFPDVPIVFGGIGATILDDHLLRYFDWIDIIVRGEGEITFPELVRRLEEQRSYSDLPGLTFRSGEHIQRNPDAERIENLDALPLPAAHYTFHHLALSRGCPGKCTYCGSPWFWGRKVRFHSADYFVRQLEILRERGQRFFHFSDDMFTLKKKLVVEICRLIVEKKLDITWAAISRVDRIDEEMLKAMRMAGCIQISFGVESGSEKIRNILNKRFNDDQIRHAFELTVSYGILARAYIIYGCPGESTDTVQDTIRLLNDIQPLVTLFHILALFPGTYLFDLYKSETGATDDIWLYLEEDLPFFKVDTNLSAEMVSQFGKQIKQVLQERIPTFIQSLELVDDIELFPFHANFLSRLALTIDRGDYPHVLEKGVAQDLAQDLYHRALEYAPDAQAFWGLGLLAQDQNDHQRAETVLKKGMKEFPQDHLLAKTLAKTLLYLGREEESRGLMREFS